MLVCLVVIKSLSGCGAADPHRTRDVSHLIMSLKVKQSMHRMFRAVLTFFFAGETAVDLEMMDGGRWRCARAVDALGSGEATVLI